MILTTKHFGEIEIDEEKIITFEEGILGFEDIKKYTVIVNPDKEVPFHWLQAVEYSDLAFVITNPFVFKKDYDFEIPEKVIEQLAIEKEEDVMIFSIAVVPEDMKKMTINLRGPLIMNIKNKKGKQIVLDTEKYSLKHCIFEEEVTENIG
ncbi:flagellar assembly protein FliW [Crassaminicella profunda]|uniref:flagellar assembly protein FliW n=1 Tax=Crassaminicella profunda TaxID=1286698 RepID=UPI001CA67E0B|nr:flagellar assembly protein FliW [Crassaminicella profunda]QZY54318.1 flagellar assembly protein FliW [Crassaminicella profunda]